MSCNEAIDRYLRWESSILNQNQVVSFPQLFYSLWRGARLLAVPSSPCLLRRSRRPEARVRTSNCAYTYTGFLLFWGILATAGGVNSPIYRGADRHTHTHACARIRAVKRGEESALKERRWSRRQRKPPRAISHGPSVEPISSRAKATHSRISTHREAREREGEWTSRRLAGAEGDRKSPPPSTTAPARTAATSTIRGLSSAAPDRAARHQHP